MDLKAKVAMTEWTQREQMVPRRGMNNDLDDGSSGREGGARGARKIGPGAPNMGLRATPPNRTLLYLFSAGMPMAAANQSTPRCQES